MATVAIVQRHLVFKDLSSGKRGNLTTCRCHCTILVYNHTLIEILVIEINYCDAGASDFFVGPLTTLRCDDKLRWGLFM